MALCSRWLRLGVPQEGPKGKESLKAYLYISVFFERSLYSAAMKGLAKVKPQAGAEFIEVETPKIKPDEVLVKIKAASVCGTDLHIYHWDEWAASRIKTPLVFGHECAGEIVELGSKVIGLKSGLQVSIETHIACTQCYQCRTGAEHLCQNVQIVGVDRSGSFTEYLAIPA